jgi:hypothetical protein
MHTHRGLGPQGGNAAIEAQPAQEEHGIAELLPQIGTTAAIVIVGTLLILHYRSKLPALFETRPRRVYLEVVVLAGLNIAMGILLSAIKWSAVGGAIPARDLTLLWIFSVVAGLFVNAQAIVVAHADTVAAERRRREEERADERIEFETQLEDARKVREFYHVVNEAFLRVVSRKRERLTKAHANARVSELQPAIQCQALVAACWEIIDGLVNEQGGSGRDRVRVAYFRVIGRQLVPEHSWDGTAGDCVTRLLGTDANVKARFDLDSASGCLAKTTSLTGKTFSVRDCAVADADMNHPFVFFHPSEKDEIRSIVALPVILPGAAAPFDVITVDTDRKGAFHNSDPVLKRQLEMVLKNLAHRLQLEKALDESLTGTT